MPIKRLTVVAILMIAAFAAAQDAPYVDSKITKERFKEVTDDDLKAIASQKILFASRSFGLNLGNGMRILAKEDKNFDILGEWKRYDVFKAGGDLSIIPADAFAKTNFVHFLATYWPHTKRMEEMDQVLRQPPQEFGKQADIVLVFFHTAQPENFEQYCSYMDKWRKDFPKIKFIYVTAGFQGPKHAKENENAHLWSEKVRERYKGKQPLYDLGKILSDDFRAGHVYCPEYSKDPNDGHPNSDEGQAMMARGMFLLLRDTLKWKGGDEPAPMAAAPKPAKTDAAKIDPADAKAVQAILTANGLTKKKVEGVSVVENGRVVKLYLQEGGVKTIPDAIGQLTELRLLHCYGDRSLKLPLLTKVSPAIAQCSKLEELLLNQNDLATLPPEIAQLTNLKVLSIADNKLKDLPEAVKAWAEKFDPKGLTDQKP
jgi:hypothetical protein